MNERDPAAWPIENGGLVIRSVGAIDRAGWAARRRGLPGENRMGKRGGISTLPRESLRWVDDGRRNG